MSLFHDIVKAYPKLTDSDFGINGSIGLRDDTDGVGEYIEKWEYSEPLPKGLKLGKPSA